MDSTLFDYKNYSNEPSRVAPRSNSKNQRPTSAQVSKFNYGNSSTGFQDYSQGGMPPPMGGINRIRPTTGGGNQYISPSEEVSRNIPNGMIEELEPEEEARIAEKASYGEQLHLPDMQKLMPRNIKVEKEKLYEDTLHLKQNINTLKEDNVKLKTRNLGLERENAKLVKTLEKMGSASASYGKPQESALLAALKKQVKETKEELKIRTDEVEGMKRNTKFTKVQELEMELRAYTEENIRLKNMFEELARSKPQINPDDYNQLEERYYMQLNLIETLQRDHARLAAEAKHFEDENYSLKMAREQDQKNAQKQQSEISRLRKQIKEKELKASAAYKLDTSAQRAAILRPDDRSRHEDDPNDLKRQVEQRNQMINQRDRTIDDLKQQLNDKMSTDMREKQSHTSEVLKLKEQYAELESKYRAMLGVHGGDDRKKTDISNSKESEQTSEYKGEQKGKKLKRVTLEDVKTAGYELSLKLRIRTIALDDVMKYLSKSGPKISVGDMKNILTHDPFGLKDENNALLMARFLVEPQDEDIITFDPNRTQDVSIIKALFKKLVGSYELLDEEDEKAMGQQLSDILHNYEESLKTQLSMMPGAKTGYLSSDDIANAFELLEVELDTSTLEYLIMNIYEYTNNLRRLDYMKMFEIFETEEHKRMKKILQMYQGEEEEEEDYEESERSEKRVKFQEAQGPAKKGRPQSAKPTQAKKQQQQQQEEEDDYEDEYQEEEEGEDYGEEDYEEEGEDDQ